MSTQSQSAITVHSFVPLVAQIIIVFDDTSEVARLKIRGTTTTSGWSLCRQQERFAKIATGILNDAAGFLRGGTMSIESVSDSARFHRTANSDAYEDTYEATHDMECTVNMEILRGDGFLVEQLQLDNDAWFMPMVHLDDFEHWQVWETIDSLRKRLTRPMKSSMEDEFGSEPDDCTKATADAGSEAKPCTETNLHPTL